MSVCQIFIRQLSFCDLRNIGNRWISFWTWARLPDLSLLPLTVSIWKRMKIMCVIIFVKSANFERLEITTELSLVLAELIRLGAIVRFFHSYKYPAVTLSQVARLFVPCVLKSTVSNHNFGQVFLQNSTLLILSDADIWPLSKQYYNSVFNSWKWRNCFNKFRLLWFILLWCQKIMWCTQYVIIYSYDIWNKLTKVDESFCSKNPTKYIENYLYDMFGAINDQHSKKGKSVMFV